VAVGLNRAPSDKGEEGQSIFTRDSGARALVQWVAQRHNGDFGVALILPSGSSSGQPRYAQDANNEMMLAPAASGQALRYYVGAAWTRAGEIASQQQWQRYVADEAARLASPVAVALSAER
jgi:hypothetical protein